MPKTHGFDLSRLSPVTLDLLKLFGNRVREGPAEGENVAGSLDDDLAGAPLWSVLRQLEAGGPLTLTREEREAFETLVEVAFNLLNETMTDLAALGLALDWLYSRRKVA